MIEQVRVFVNGFVLSKKEIALREGRSVVAVPCPDYQVLSIPHPDIDGVIQTIGLERIGAVQHVVLVAQLVGDVLKALRQVLRLEGKEGLAAGLGREPAQDTV